MGASLRTHYLSFITYSFLPISEMSFDMSDDDMPALIPLYPLYPLFPLESGPSPSPASGPAAASCVFHDLIAAYPSWALLRAFLVSEAGGSLHIAGDAGSYHGNIENNARYYNPYVLIRYIKGKSNLALPHVGAFRSVVWDIIKNRPVSVTPFKSEAGESLPANATATATDSTEGYRVEEFVDGVMIGMFYDTYTSNWRIHTRSTLDAECSYYSTRTFATLFHEATAAIPLSTYNTDRTYTWVLQHPEHRIVTYSDRPTAICVQISKIHADCAVEIHSPSHWGAQQYAFLHTWTDVRHEIRKWDCADHVLLEDRFANRRPLKHGAFRQGLVVKDNTGKRWKLRTPTYNQIRAIRGNTPRRDFMWLTAWRNGTLPEYSAIYYEERHEIHAIVEAWKRATNDVFHIYRDVFKAHILPTAEIPVKYRPLVYGLHGLYVDTLRPANQTLQWKNVCQYMNTRDVAQMLFVLNWDRNRRAAETATAARDDPVLAVYGTSILGAAPVSHRRTASASLSEGETVD